MLVIVLTFSIDCGASPAGAIARGVYISYVTSETSIANAFEVRRKQATGRATAVPLFVWSSVLN